jgi:hypothetical protein
VKREGALNPSAKANFADGECLAKSTTVATNNYALENLNTGTGSFNDSNVNLYVIARAEIWDTSAQRCCVNFI